MMGVFEIDDHTLEPCAERLLGVAARGRWGQIVAAALRAVQAALLHFNHLGADRRKFKQLVATLDRLSVGSEIGSTALALGDALVREQIGRVAPDAGAAEVSRLWAMFGFVLGWTLLGLLVTRGWLRGIGRGGGRLGRRQLRFELLKLVEQLDDEFDQRRFIQLG
jgi:hypothetical protein